MFLDDNFPFCSCSSSGIFLIFFFLASIFSATLIFFSGSSLPRSRFFFEAWTPSFGEWGHASDIKKMIILIILMIILMNHLEVCRNLMMYHVKLLGRSHLIYIVVATLDGACQKARLIERVVPIDLLKEPAPILTAFFKVIEFPTIDIYFLFYCFFKYLFLVVTKKTSKTCLFYSL